MSYARQLASKGGEFYMCAMHIHSRGAAWVIEECGEIVKEPLRQEFETQVHNANGITILANPGDLNAFTGKRVKVVVTEIQEDNL